MVPLNTSYDSDGFYDDEELEDLLRAEPVDDTNLNSDESEEVVLWKSTPQISYRHRKISQHHPADSHIGQIIKRLEREGTPLPCYLYWPWPKIRSFFHGFILLGFLVTIVTLFWLVFQFVNYPEVCVNSINKAVPKWWTGGPWFNTAQHPNACASFLDVNADVLKGNGVSTIWLGSSAWSSNIEFTNGTLVHIKKSSGFLEDTARICHDQGFKLVLTIYIADIICKFDKNHKGCAISSDDVPVTTTSTSPGDETSDQLDWGSLFSALVAAGVDGFHLPNLSHLPDHQFKHILRSLDIARANQTSAGTPLMTDSASAAAVTSPKVPLVVVSADLELSSASALAGWLEDLYNTTGHVNTTHLFALTCGGDAASLNVKLLEVLLPGIPLLEEACFKDLATGGSNNQSQLQVLLQLRKHAPALQGDNFSILRVDSHLEHNVFAILRMFREEKRYLVFWNFNNFTVSLDFHQLSFQGRWVTRSVLSQQVPGYVNLRHIDGVLANELGVIELP